MKGWGLKEITWIGFFGFVAWMVFAPHAGAAGLPAPPAGAGVPAAPRGQAPTDVGTLLTPVVAAATSIERILEMIWNWFESAAQQLVATLGLGKEWAKYTRQQVISAQNTLATLAHQATVLEARMLNQPPPPPAAPPDPNDPTRALQEEHQGIIQKIDAAQTKLKDAQEQLASALTSPVYKSRKQSLSVLLGLVFGLITSFTTGMNIFDLLTIPNTGNFGIFVTGLVIGAGTGPVHSLLGILQQSRDALDQVANLFSARSQRTITEQYTALTQSNLAVAQAQTQAANQVAQARGLEAAAPVPMPDPTPTEEQLRTITRLSRRHSR
jgi:hypothetical protein